MSKGSILLFLILILASCGNKNGRSADVLPPDKMSEVLWDVIRVDAFTTSYIKKDSTKNAAAENAKMQMKVFTDHHVTRESFYNSFAYYKKNPVQFKTILDSLVNRKTRERANSNFQVN